MATASQLLYECPYARSAGRFAPALQLDITEALGVLNHRVSSHAAPKIARPTPFVPPPPAAVTTHSFGELLKSRTRPGRYGPAEVSSSDRSAQGRAACSPAASSCTARAVSSPAHLIPSLSVSALQIYDRPVTESQEAGFKVALASIKR